jgi:hypothetical protein
MNEISFTIDGEEYIVPTEMTIRHYQDIVGKESLLEGNQRDVHILNILTGAPIDKLRKVKHTELQTLARYCYRGIETPDTTFFKTFEFKGEKFGFIPNLSTITTAEFVDLDDYISSGVVKNLHKIMSVLYRPLKYTKEFLGEFRWDIEEYDSDTHKIQSEKFRDLPYKYVAGSSVFFYSFGKEFMNSMLNSLTPEEREMIQNNNPQVSLQTFQKDLENIGNGGQYLTHWQTTNLKT